MAKMPEVNVEVPFEKRVLIANKLVVMFTDAASTIQRMHDYKNDIVVHASRGEVRHLNGNWVESAVVMEQWIEDNLRWSGGIRTFVDFLNRMELLNVEQVRYLEQYANRLYKWASISMISLTQMYPVERNAWKALRCLKSAVANDIMNVLLTEKEQQAIDTEKARKAEIKNLKKQANTALKYRSVNELRELVDVFGLEDVKRNTKSSMSGKLYNAVAEEIDAEGDASWKYRVLMATREGWHRLKGWLTAADVDIDDAVDYDNQVPLWLLYADNYDVVQEIRREEREELEKELVDDYND